MKKLGSSLLLIDCSNVLHKMIHVHKRLIYKGKFTGGVYGFAKQLLKSIEDSNADHVMVCKDSPPYLRKDIYPDYKGDRNYNDEVFFMKLTQSKKFLDEFLNACGIQTVEFEGYEADDIIAQACMTYTYRFNKIFIKSNDDDLYQLLRFKNVSLIKSKDAIYNHKDFNDQYGIKPTRWIDVIALKGSHNNVQGIKGVGPVNALKIVKDKDLWDKYYADYKKMIELNRKVIKLPLKNLTIPIVKKSYNKRELGDFFHKTAIRISLKEIEHVMLNLN